MDQGRPLEQSPPGPWTSHLSANATSLPIIQYHPKMAFRATSNRLYPDASTSADVLQSTSILPLQYESLVALVDLARRAPQDPLAMCIPLFAHAAFSEVQFLNLMDSSIQKEMSAVTEAAAADTVAAFQYYSNILNRHAQQLKESTQALCRLSERSGQSSGGLRVEGPTTKRAVSPNPGMGSPRQVPMADAVRSIGSDGAFTAKGLLEDFEQLHVRAVDLSKMCDRGISLAMNKATIEESRKVVEQSERLKKLALLVTLFIPLSFSSSLFSMNISLLGQGSVQVWWFFLLCIPITLSASIFYFWDSQVVQRWWMMLRKQCRNLRRDITVGRSEKDPSHLV